MHEPPAPDKIKHNDIKAQKQVLSRFFLLTVFIKMNFYIVLGSNANISLLYILHV